MQSKDINRILSNQSQVNKFLSFLNDSKLKEGPTINKGWMAPIDRIYNRYDLIELSLTYQDIDSITTVIKLINENVLLNTSLVSLQPIFYPKQVRACPSLSEIKNKLSNESLIITVHSYSGYSFSAEYTHVYQNKFVKETAYEDLAVTIKRALRTVDPLISDERCSRFSEFMITMAAWESLISISVYESTFSALLPAWKSYPKEFVSSVSFQYVEIYIGRDTSSGISSCDISFTVRIRDRLQFDQPIGSDPPAVASTVACDYIYYRDIILDDKSVESFHHHRALDVMSMQQSQAGKNKTKGSTFFVPPPPPPKRSTANGEVSNDIRVSLCLTFPHTSNNINTISTNDEEMDQKARHLRQNQSIDATDLLKQEESSSFFSQLVGWGFNASDSLGLGAVLKALRKRGGMSNSSSDGDGDGANKNDTALVDQDLVVGVHVVPLDRIIHIERIKMIACSGNHTMLLTAMGSVYACGNNAEGALGTGDFVSRSSMTLVECPDVSTKANATSFHGKKIVKIAVGSSTIGSHSMAIDDSGNLYGWGVAYALGLGVVKAIVSPTYVSVGTIQHPLNQPGNGDDDGSQGWHLIDDDPTNNVNADELFGHSREDLKYIVDVACGGGFTVCVTRAGHVFSWGTWSHGRLGLGPIPLERAPKKGMRAGAKKTARYQLHPRRIRGIEGALSVSCGEAHALCVLKDGCLLAWGQNSCGQVGSGPSNVGYLSDAFRPVLIPFFGSYSDHNRKLLDKFTMKNCSEAYDLNMNKLMKKSKSSQSNQHVHENDRGGASTNDAASGHALAGAKMVCCGAFHSVCVDDKGVAWTWGARGSPCLGHNDSPIVGTWNSRINHIFSISITDSKVMVPYELMDWCMTWSMPRMVRSLAGGSLSHYYSDRSTTSSLPADDASLSTFANTNVSAKQKIKQVCATDLCTGFLSEEGRLFLCGTGPTVPDFVCTRPRPDDLDDDHPSHDRDVDEDEDDRDDNHTSDYQTTIVSSPRCPSDSWLRELCTRRVAYIAGSGSKMFAIVDDEYASSMVTAPMLSQLLATPDSEQEHLRSLDFTGGHEDSSVVSSLGARSSHLDSLFESRGKVDCMILASGKVFLCHKAFLAQRSSELRNMIIMESPSNDASSSSTSIVQILLPELHREAAKALVYFLYRDTLPPWSISSVSILSALTRMGKTLRIPRLEIMCSRFLRLLKYDTIPIDATDSRDRGYRDGNNKRATMDYQMDLDIPPPTLARDLSALVADPEFADVRFVAEGRAIVAHRFILEARCPYFRAMFRSGMMETTRNGSYSDRGRMVDVVVPDTFVGFLRLLIFIYTGTLPDGSDGAILEDLMAADRYTMTDMKLLCENMLVPSEHNWLDLLRASQLLNSVRLELQVMSYLKDHFHVLESLFHTEDSPNGGSDGHINDHDSTVQYENIHDFQAEFPGLLDALLEARKQLFPLPPSQLLIAQSTSRNNDDSSSLRTPMFPLWSLTVTVICLMIYLIMTKFVAFGALIPIINVVVMGIVLYFLIRNMLSE